MWEIPEMEEQVESLSQLFPSFLWNEDKPEQFHQVALSLSGMSGPFGSEKIFIRHVEMPT